MTGLFSGNVLTCPTLYPSFGPDFLTHDHGQGDEIKDDDRGATSVFLC